MKQVRRLKQLNQEYINQEKKNRRLSNKLGIRKHPILATAVPLLQLTGVTPEVVLETGEHAEEVPEMVAVVAEVEVLEKEATVQLVLIQEQKSSFRPISISNYLPQRSTRKRQ